MPSRRARYLMMTDTATATHSTEHGGDNDNDDDDDDIVKDVAISPSSSSSSSSIQRSPCTNPRQPKRPRIRCRAKIIDIPHEADDLVVRLANFCSSPSHLQPQQHPTTTTAPVHIPSGISNHHNHHHVCDTISLSELISPLDECVFINHCFRQRAVHAPCSIASSGKDRLNMLCQELFDLDPREVMGATASESIFVWLRKNPLIMNHHHHHHHSIANDRNCNINSQNRLDLIQSIEVGDPNTALALLEAGHATYCRAPPDLERMLVARLLADTGLGCGQYDPTGESTAALGRGEVEIFWGTRGHRTNWHWDFQENFTIQLSGVKRWTLHAGSVTHPLRACTPHYQSLDSVEPQLKAAHLVDPTFEFGHPADSSFSGASSTPSDCELHHPHSKEVILQPGDVLYFPAGMWHKVDVIEPGVSLNISLMASNYASVTCQALQHVLVQKREWRECILHHPASNQDAVQHLKVLLRQLPGIIEEFEQCNGAEAILPPAVRRNRRQSSSLFLDKGGHSQYHPTEWCEMFVKSEDDFEKEDDTNQDVDEDDDDDFGESSTKEVIDLTRVRFSKTIPFQCPTESQLSDRWKTHRLIRNPLATMLRESDMYKFYKRGDESEDDSSSVTEVYVINVNYAGNESHESMIRARIRETGRLLPHVFSAAIRSKQSNHPHEHLVPPIESWISIESERLMLGCLVYHGFMLWIPR